jgi:hydrogenase expression/formation protein HypD
MNSDTPAYWLEKIQALLLPARVRIMNVCGGHEHSIIMAGLRSALLESIELIPGPGCPVCICPGEGVFGKIYPNECRLFGVACQPRRLTA